ncbi:unnamed protein product [Rotaria sp. Silwood2]|nr:unnamed protein product [Rotaria sp. Silwood2]CAF3142433.1 unnamed protein product [Rotaria sp. Silwood2]
MIYDFYCTGSDDQLTLIDNEQAFHRIKLSPKILIDVSSHSALNSVSCQTHLLNSTITISFPCILAPTALHRLSSNEHGQLATFRAAVACSTIMCISTMVSICMERIADEHWEQIKANYPRSTSQLRYKLYVFKNRQDTQRLIEHAERCGYKALVVTVDHCEVGNRECDIHNQFSLPYGIQVENIIDDKCNDFAKAYCRAPIDASLP